jgi:hypothetical protein
MFEPGMSRTLQDAGVVHQDFDVPAQGLLSVALVCDVKLLDLELYTTRCGLPLQGLHLRVDLDRGDDVEAFFRKPHGSFESEASTGPCEQHSSHDYLLGSFR